MGEIREHSPAAFSPGGDELFFSRQTRFPDGTRHFGIWAMRLEDGLWTAPEMSSFGSVRADTGSFSSDGRWFYYHSWRGETPESPVRDNASLWRTQKLEDGWGEPEVLSGLSSFAHDIIPLTTESGALYFNSQREDGGDSDVYVAAAGVAGPVARLDATINTDQEESVVYVDPEERFLLFYYNDQSDGLSRRYLKMSIREPDGGWSAPIDLANALELRSTDILRATVTADGRCLFQLDDADIYWADARVLERVFDAHREGMSR